MQARMSNPATILPDAMNAILTLLKAARKGGVPSATLELVHLRASQINGCSACVDSGARSAKKAGETDERLFAVAAWREAPYFTDAERAALALTEAITRYFADPDLQAKLRANAVSSVAAYAPDQIYARLEQILIEAAA